MKFQVKCIKSDSANYNVGSMYWMTEFLTAKFGDWNIGNFIQIEDEYNIKRNLTLEQARQYFDMSKFEKLKVFL